MNTATQAIPLDTQPDRDAHDAPKTSSATVVFSQSMTKSFAYATVAILVGLTGALGGSLTSANLGVIQGQLGITPMQGTWFVVAYAMFNVTANLLLFKFRQQFGIRLFAQLGLAVYAVLSLLHLLADSYETALLVRAASGFASAIASTLCTMYMLQALPKAKLGQGVIIGLSVTQLATPLAWIISPSLLEAGDWRALYTFETGLALCSFAAVMLLKLPEGVRTKVLEPWDFLTFALVTPGIALFAAVLAQGVRGWWLDTEWLGWAWASSIVLLVAAGLFEFGRTTPLIMVRWLFNLGTVRFVIGALIMRFLLSEQSYGAIGLLKTLGMGPDQLHTLYVVIFWGVATGIAISVLTFGPRSIMVQILVSAALVFVAGYMDLDSSSLSRPEDFYVSQFILAMASGMFMGPIMLIGGLQAVKYGADHMVTFLVLFSITQSIGGLMGPALLGTLQIKLTQEYALSIRSEMPTTNPIVTQRIAQGQHGLAPIVTDPVQRTAQSARQLGVSVYREAAVRSFNYVFTMLCVFCVVFMLWLLHWAVNLARSAKSNPLIPH